MESVQLKGQQEVWRRVYRPGFFGRRRDQIVRELNDKYGTGNWDLRWCTSAFPDGLTFNEACILCYEYSYLCWFMEFPNDVDFICSFGECIDNAPTNVQSGCDYEKQEAFSTHIQDIAVRNVLKLLGRKFEGDKDNILVIRSTDSNGHRYGPGNIPYFNPTDIIYPSKCPKWANYGSVEDFWQSNKWVFVRTV